ncbi:E3 ubiquitin-protein ligase [Acrasis kona]|uniref:E3 ubiquitin-protein ligase n=1 Tax=Acrasis kona TaxID=1008807 RepID=A0AAW2Z041_9EUKA
MGYQTRPDNQFGDPMFNPPSMSMSMPSVDGGDETSEIERLIQSSSQDWMPDKNMDSRYQPRKIPPPNYLCHRCKKPGHFIQHCPTNGDPRFNIKTVRKPTGIPRSFLRQVTGEEGDMEGTLALGEGVYAVMEPNESEFEKVKAQEKNTFGFGTDVPENLKCFTCHQLLREPVSIPCCGATFCSHCISHVLANETNFHCPKCHRADQRIEMLTKNDKARESVEEFKNSTNRSQGTTNTHDPFKQNNSYLTTTTYGNKDSLSSIMDDFQIPHANSIDAPIRSMPSSYIQSTYNNNTTSSFGGGITSTIGDQTLSQNNSSQNERDLKRRKTEAESTTSREYIPTKTASDDRVKREDEDRKLSREKRSSSREREKYSSRSDDRSSSQRDDNNSSYKDYRDKSSSHRDEKSSSSSSYRDEKSSSSSSSHRSSSSSRDDRYASSRSDDKPSSSSSSSSRRDDKDRSSSYRDDKERTSSSHRDDKDRSSSSSSYRDDRDRSSSSSYRDDRYRDDKERSSSSRRDDRYSSSSSSSHRDERSSSSNRDDKERSSSSHRESSRKDDKYRDDKYRDDRDDKYRDDKSRDDKYRDEKKSSSSSSSSRHYEERSSRR